MCVCMCIYLCVHVCVYVYVCVCVYVCVWFVCVCGVCVCGVCVCVCDLETPISMRRPRPDLGIAAQKKKLFCFFSVGT